MITFIQTLDLRAIEALYAIRDPLLVQLAIIVSELGRATTICGLALALGLFLIVRRHPVYFMGLFITLAASGFGTLVLKGVVARPRPPIALQAYHEIWWSFPSAHAALSLSFYGFVVYLILRVSRFALSRYIAILVGAFLIIAIGFSRLYLGVHYPSDVIGGYVLGALSLWLGIWTIREYANS